MHFKLITIQMIFLLQLVASAVNGPEKQHELETGAKYIQLKEHSIHHDLWIHVKEQLNIIRHRIKELHEEIKKKIYILIENIERRVDEILANVDETCDKLNERITAILQGILIQTPVIRRCFAEGIEVFTNYRRIVRNEVRHCIDDKTHNTESLYELDNSDFISCDEIFNDEIEKKYNECKMKLDDSEYCIDNVKTETYKILQETEYDLHNAVKNAEAKVKGIIGAITSCAAEGINQVSTYIPVVISDIVKCIVDRNNDKM